MVKLTKIYTRGGDKGETSLASGARVEKSGLRIEAIGAVDEVNAAIGLARTHTADDAEAMLGRIQNDLFDLGADLATPADPSQDPDHTQGLRVSPAQTQRLEEELDGMGEVLAPLTSFVLPGGSEASARLHMARTIARRAERAIVRLAASEPINPDALTYVNRLSDHLFQMARLLNDRGATDVLWVPGENR